MGGASPSQRCREDLSDLTGVISGPAEKRTAFAAYVRDCRESGISLSNYATVILEQIRTPELRRFVETMRESGFSDAKIVSVLAYSSDGETPGAEAGR